MMVNYLKYVPLLLLAVCFVTSCNNDVFIDGPEMPYETTETVEGDGGEVSFWIQTKSLKSISIDHYSDDLGFSFFNHKGEQVKEECPASELARIHYENRWNIFDMTVDGDRVTFHNIENCRSDMVSRTIRLQYDYTVKFVHINILPGKPTEIIGTTYNPEIYVDKAQYVTYRTLRVSNASSQTTQVGVKPYMTVQSSCTVESKAIWSHFIKANIAVPTYTDGRWCMGDERYLSLSSNEVYVSANSDVTEIVDVPANSTMSIVTTVIMSKAKSGGTIEFLNPVSGRRFSTEFTCEVMEPIDYTISTYNEN